LQPIINGIERTAGNEPILFWGFPERFLYLSLARRTDNVVPSSLLSVLEKVKYRQFSGNDMPNHGYVVGTDTGLLTRQKLDAALFGIYGLPLESDSLRRYPDSVGVYGPILLTYVHSR
jgi:hypothetical protein